MKELTKEEAQKLKVGTEFVIYNPLTKQLKTEIASPVDIAHNKHCYNKLRFFIVETNEHLFDDVSKLLKGEE